MDSSGGVKLFVGGLPTHATDEDLIQSFRYFAPVLRAKVEVTRHLKISRGFGYVTMADREVIPQILASEIRILGSKVDVKIAIDKSSQTPKSSVNSPTHTGCSRSFPTTYEGSPAFTPKPSKPQFSSKNACKARKITSMVNYGRGTTFKFLQPIPAHPEIEDYHKTAITPKIDHPSTLNKLPSRWANAALNEYESNYKFNLLSRPVQGLRE